MHFKKSSMKIIVLKPLNDDFYFGSVFIINKFIFNKKSLDNHKFICYSMRSLSEERL